MANSIMMCVNHLFVRNNVGRIEYRTSEVSIKLNCLSELIINITFGRFALAY